MALPPDAAQLVAPASVLKIAEFLVDIRARQTLGGKVEAGDIWDRHDITVGHVDEFLSWLHVDRVAQPSKEMQFLKGPEQSLIKKAPDQPEESSEGRTEGLASASEEPPINIHLWNALFKSEAGWRRRQVPQARYTPVADRKSLATTPDTRRFNLPVGWQGPPGQSLRMDQSGAILPGEYVTNAKSPSDTGGENPSQPLPQHLTNGLSAKAFGNQIENRANGLQPLWNEPVRRDLMPQLAKKDKFLDIGALPTLAAFALAKPGETPGAGSPFDQKEAPISDALFGQITLVAPPLDVSPEMGQGAAMGLRFDWRDMAKGAGLVDYPQLVTLASTLPEGSKVLYPAIDPYQLRGGAVNLRLEPRLAEGLVAQGYGVPGRVDARKSARLAAAWHGGTPPVGLLPATMIPLNRIGRRKAGIDPDSLPQGGTVKPSEDAARRMRFIDFIGLPIYLSPYLNTSPDLEHEYRARISAEFMPRAPLISPLAFSNLRSQMLGGFYGVEAKPELGTWRRAMPDYDRAGSSIAGMLTNRLRMGAMGDGITSATAPIPRSAALPAFGQAAKQFGPTFLPTIPGAALGARSPLRPSSFAPPSIPSPSIGSPAQGEAPRFIRHQPKATAGVTPSFQPVIPAMQSGQTAPIGPAKTVPKGSESASHLRVSPQITVAAEKATSKPKSIGAKQAPPSPAPVRQPAPMEGPKPSKATMMPHSQSPRAVSPPAPTKAKASDNKATPSPDLGSPMPSGSALKPPQMLIAPPRGVPGPKGESEPLAIQTSTATPGGAAPNESGASRSAEVGEKKESGLPGSEINLLANEVWILLKRRLAFEAQRMGR